MHFEELDIDHSLRSLLSVNQARSCPNQAFPYNFHSFNLFAPVVSYRLISYHHPSAKELCIGSQTVIAICSMSPLIRIAAELNWWFHQLMPCLLSCFTLGTQLHPAYVPFYYVFLLWLYISSTGASWRGGDNTAQTPASLKHHVKGMWIHKEK